jgi:mono/diheme cytochrome c family protein
MMRYIQFLLQMPILCAILTAAFTIGVHVFQWVEVAEIKYVTIEVPDDVGVELTGTTAIANYCGGCHQSGRSGVDFDSDTLVLEEMRRDPDTWTQVVKRLRSKQMPPARFPQPSAKERASLITWIEKEVLSAPITPGTGPLMARRLQRSEYLNTMRDLLGVSVDSKLDIPKDDLFWHRCSDAPALAPELLASYRTAAETILDHAIAAELESDAACLPNGIASGTRLFSTDCSFETSVANARSILGGFVRRAYRKPADAAEVDRLVAIFEQAEKENRSFHEGMKLALAEVLTSPQFLYRIESRTGTPHANDSFALASRLSYFLWRSGADEELLAHAAASTLEQNLESQARRMLQDPRSHAFAVDFADQWFSFGKLKVLFDFDPALTDAMRQETELFVAGIVREDRSVLEFFQADYTYLNERLARHYGIPDIRGDDMRRVQLAGIQRGGLLGQASILVVSSPYNETSPVSRGKWVVENLLGEPPIKPPPGLLAALQDSTRSVATQSGSLGQQMALHRENKSCAQCHEKLDTIGLALETFDPRGAWRGESNPRAADAVGTLSSGEVIRGPAELKAYLLTQRAPLVRSLSERLLRFALGRKLDDRDRAALEHLPANADAQNYRISRIILDVIQSESFRRGSRELE